MLQVRSRHVVIILCARSQIQPEEGLIGIATVSAWRSGVIGVAVEMNTGARVRETFEVHAPRGVLVPVIIVEVRALRGEPRHIHGPADLAGQAVGAAGKAVQIVTAPFALKEKPRPCSGY